MKSSSRRISPQIVSSHAILKIEVEGVKDDYHPALAISLSVYGEELAYGGSVETCSNLTNLFKDRYLSTHKWHTDRIKARRTPRGLITRLDALLAQTNRFLENDLQYIEQLKSKAVNLY